MDVFEAENQFYLHCPPSRISKFLAHAKLYEMSLGLPGSFVEAGIFKGASFCRFRKLGRLFHPDHHRRFIGFDMFGRFPEAEFEPDKAKRERLVAAAGDTGIGLDRLLGMLAEQGLADNVELVQGDVRETLPRFLEENQEMSVSIVNIDLDLYDPVKAVLEYLFERVVRGGIVILDDYEGFPGARRAIDEFLSEHDRPETIRKFPFAQSPCYLIKE